MGSSETMPTARLHPSYVHGQDHDEPNDVCGDGGNAVGIDRFQIVQGMMRQMQKLRPNPSIHYRLAPPLSLLDPSDPYQYHHHLQFQCRVGMYQMVIQGVAPSDGVIDECKLL